MTDSNPQWHRLTVAEALAVLGSDARNGLWRDEAARRLAEFGENRLDEVRPRPIWLRFLDQFRNLLVVVLAAAAVLAWAVGDLKDAAVILGVVVLNAVLGFRQEYRAEKTLATLKKMFTARARVRREGRVEEIDACLLVPGDVVLLEAGDRIPADGRLLAAHNLEVDEAALTGESHPVGKGVESMDALDPPLGDCLNRLFMNTVVTRGRAELLVTATGMATEMGRLAGLIATAPESETPLQRRLDVLGKRLALIASGVVVLIFWQDVSRGLHWSEAALTAVALAVAAIPEGLPAVVTVTLAIGMWRMAKSRALVKRLAAVETLGSTTVICTDKTGTLTLNQMTARAGWLAGERFQVSGEGYEPKGEIHFERTPAGLVELLLPMALCTESRVRDGKLIGDPTEGALWVLAQKGGLDPEAEQEQAPRIAEIPFDAAHRFMATFHHDGEWVRLYVKGAPDALVACSTTCSTMEGVQPLDGVVLASIEAENERLARQALRVLAVARRDIPAREFDPAGDLWHWAEGWTFLGLVGLMDPPRPEARAAIEECRRAGIAVKMITGDHRVTAAAIAEELGLAGKVIDGKELDAMDEAELARRIDGMAVFARVAPEHKVKIVAVLRSLGHVTAMTGDGVNDAPALKAADIGVAMGMSGTEVTKEAATLVLTDDNFATIVRAVEEGRVIFDNIVKFVRFQLATNIGAILTVSAAALLGMPTPFTAVQILWINIIMDGPPAMTLGVEPARKGVMLEPPRPPDRQILDAARMAKLLFHGAVMMVGVIVLFDYGLRTGGEGRGITLAFTTFVLFQLFNAFNARAEHESAFGSHFFRNGRLWLALGSVLLLQVLAIHWGPAQGVFHTLDLTGFEWGLAVLTASSLLWLEEGRKLLGRVGRRIGCTA